MKTVHMRSICFIFLILLAFSFNRVWAEYPERPITMIAPFGAGGGADLGSRIMAEHMSKFLGQPMVSEYKPGAGGALAVGSLMKAPADGYTVLIGSPTPLVLSTITTKVDYKLDDFKLVGTFACIPLWLAVKSDAQWKTLEEFVQDAKKNPGKLSIGTYGSLTAADFLVQALSRDAGVSVINVPFKSTPEALTNVVGDHVDAALVTGGGGLLKGGAVRILAVAHQSRLEGLPDLPTFTEAGYPIVMEACYTFAVKKDTPKAIIDRLYQAQKKAMETDPEKIKRDFQAADLWPRLSTPDEAVAQYKESYDLFYNLAGQMGALAKKSDSPPKR